MAILLNKYVLGDGNSDYFAFNITKVLSVDSGHDKVTIKFQIVDETNITIDFVDLYYEEDLDEDDLNKIFEIANHLIDNADSSSKGYLDKQDFIDLIKSVIYDQ